MPLSARDLDSNCSWDGALVVLCTIWAIILTAVLEVVTHWNFDHTPSQSEDVELVMAKSGENASTTPQQHQQRQQQLPIEAFWCSKSIPTPRSRATRFAVGLVVYLGIVALFSVRMFEATGYIYPCKRYKEDWTAITFLNIIPFTWATMAFVRPVVDCVLVRYDSFLGNGNSKRGAMVWRPFPPAYAVFVVVAALVRLVLECLRILPALVMGRAEVSMFTRGRGEETGRGDEEMGGEEEGRRLIEDVDGVEEGEPPEYEEAMGIKVAH